MVLSSVFAILATLVAVVLRHPLPRLSQLGPDYVVDMAVNGGVLAETGLAMLAILGFLYFFLFTALRGQTFGKHLMRVKVIDAYGERPSIGRALMRTVAYLPSLAAAGARLSVDRLRSREARAARLARRHLRGESMTSRLASLLVQDGLVSAKKMAEAFQRQVIYGGTLDTILLEMDVIDEATLLDALGRCSALPIAGDLPSLEQLQAADVQKWMPPAMSERFRAVPVALDGNKLRVLVIDPPDRKQLDELGYTLSLTIEPIIVPEHRFVQAVELVYGVPVPARFAVAGGEAAPARDRSQPRQAHADADGAGDAATAPAAAGRPRRGAAADGASAPAAAGRPRRGAAADGAGDGASAPATAGRSRRGAARRRSGQTGQADRAAACPAGDDGAGRGAGPRRCARWSPTCRCRAPSRRRRRPRNRRPRAEPIAPAAAGGARVVRATRHRSQQRRRRCPSSHADPTPLSIEAARQAIDAAADRDGIFESLCRGTRARLPFAAILTVHGDLAAGKLALGADLVRPARARRGLRGARQAVGRSALRPSAARPTSGGSATTRWARTILASLARKPPLPALLIPVVLRDRAVALLYADNDGAELEGDVVAELSTLTAAAARSFQRLILRAKGGEYAKAAPTLVAGGPKLQPAPAPAPPPAPPPAPAPTPPPAPAPKPGVGGRLAPGGQRWRRAAHAPDAAALLGGAGQRGQRRAADGQPHPHRQSAAARRRGAARPCTTLPTAPLPDVEGLLASVERQDEHAAMSAEALLAIGERAATALVARLPGPLRLDRHTLRGATPPLGEHGPLLAVLQRMGRTARDPLLARLGDSSLEVRYYATLALGELRSGDVVAPLGKRLYDPDAGVRRAAVEALVHFPDSPELLALVEQLRGELPGPDALRQRYAAEALGVFRDATSVPRLIELVKHADSTVVTTARKALIEVTKQDFGTSRWRWRGWWERHRAQPRVEWLLEGLAHAEPEVRLSAAAELRGLAPQEFGYAFDGPKREREVSRKKWVDWVRSHPPKQQDKR